MKQFIFIAFALMSSLAWSNGLMYMSMYENFKKQCNAIVDEGMSLVKIKQTVLDQSDLADQDIAKLNELNQHCYNRANSYARVQSIPGTPGFARGINNHHFQQAKRNIQSYVDQLKNETTTLGNEPYIYSMK